MENITDLLLKKAPYESCPSFQQNLKDFLELDLTKIEAKDKALAIYSFHCIKDAMHQIAWAESTSDWDPYLIINTKEKQFETDSGMTNIEFLAEDSSIIQFDSWINAANVAKIRFGYDEDTEFIVLPINDIARIKVVAY
jgi:hypothetical protein